MSVQFDLDSTRRSRKPEVKSLKPKKTTYYKPQASQPAIHEIAGYMPARKEFESEFDNEAEQYCRELSFDPSDTKEDQELKYAIMDIYNTALDRRAERKKFIIDRGLIEYRKVKTRKANRL